MANVARLASLGAVFSFLNTMYPYVVICRSDGTYSHLTYFEKKQKYKSKPQHIALLLAVLTPRQYFRFRHGVLTPTLPSLNQCSTPALETTIVH